MDIIESENCKLKDIINLKNEEIHAQHNPM